ncbi:hypothetical protein AB4Y38_42390, partial [Paraburkholderia sp. EG285A]|uniref:hypothetical protein n=1 Tax=Paraburkholderia sp. EG285A TaxID=3237009 RepID=UPI0034D15ED4
CSRALPSRTANRCRTIGRFSRNSPLDIDRHDAAHTPLLTLAHFLVVVSDTQWALFCDAFGLAE